MSTAIAFTAFKELLRTDLKIFKQTFSDKVINLGIWVALNALITAYLMPAFGLSLDYTNFLIAGLCASAGLFEVFPSVVNVVSDLEGDRVIEYYFTLPLPSWLVIIKSIAYYAISSAALSIFVLPFSKLILWHRFDLSNFNAIKFAVIFVLTNIFYGAFIPWIASRVANMPKIGNVWMRFVFPLWFIGGFQFSWAVFYDKAPWLAYLNLLNPLTYIMEGTRSAILGSQNYLSFLLCVGMLILFIALCIFAAVRKFKKRLDFV